MTVTTEDLGSARVIRWDRQARRAPGTSRR